MWKTTLKSICAHKRRLLGTSSAVVLGVAFLAATLVLGDTMEAGFGDMFTEANAGTDAVVRSGPRSADDDVSERGLLDASIVDDIAAVDGVATAVPEITASPRSWAPTANRSAATVLRLWPATGSTIRDQPLAARRRPRPEGPDEVVIDKASADKGDLAVGDTTTIRTPQPIEVTVSASPPSVRPTGPARDLRGFHHRLRAAVLLPEPGQISDVLVAADDGVSQQELVDRLEPVLPDGSEAITGAALTDEQQRTWRATSSGSSRRSCSCSPASPCSSPPSASTTRSRSSSPSAPANPRCCGPSARRAGRCSAPRWSRRSWWACWRRPSAWPPAWVWQPG